MKRAWAQAAEEAEAVEARTTHRRHSTWHAFVCVDPDHGTRVRAYYVDERHARATPLLAAALAGAHAASSAAERALMAAVTRLLDEVTSVARAATGYVPRAAYPSSTLCAAHPSLRAWLDAVHEADHAGVSELEAWRVARHGRLPGNRAYHVHAFEL